MHWTGAVIWPFRHWSMFAAGFAARASIGAAMTIASRKNVAASMRPARSAQARAIVVSRTDSSIFSLPLDPPGPQVEKALDSRRKLQKKRREFNQLGGPIETAVALYSNFRPRVSLPRSAATVPPPAITSATNVSGQNVPPVASLRL